MQQKILILRLILLRVKFKCFNKLPKCINRSSVAAEKTFKTMQVNDFAAVVKHSFSQFNL